MKRLKFREGNIYHIYNRGVEKRTVFLGEKDYRRFIYGLHEFNNEQPATNIYRLSLSDPSLFEVRLQTKRKSLVEILTFCLMPNHYHLMIRALSEHGITEFMRKLGTGYTNYFNLKYQRVGPLFQGKFKAALLEKEPHFIYLPYYIHFNPLELAPAPKNKSTGDLDKFLRSYRWSSHLDYLGISNFPIITQRDFLLDYIGGPDQYEKNVVKMLKERNFSDIQEALLD
ncbi:MAG: transposase [bacterium]|nr:transposase [bacterium]